MLIWRMNWAPLLRSPWREKMAKTVSTFPCLQRRMVKANDVPSNKSNLIGFVGPNVAAAMLIAGNYVCRSAEPTKWRREASFEWRKTRCLHQMMLVWLWCTNTNISNAQMRWDEIFWQTSNDYRAKFVALFFVFQLNLSSFLDLASLCPPCETFENVKANTFEEKRERENRMKNGKSIVATFSLSSIVFSIGCWFLLSLLQEKAKGKGNKIFNFNLFLLRCIGYVAITICRLPLSPRSLFVHPRSFHNSSAPYPWPSDGCQISKYYVNSWEWNSFLLPNDSFTMAQMLLCNKTLCFFTE